MINTIFPFVKKKYNISYKDISNKQPLISLKKTLIKKECVFYI